MKTKEKMARKMMSNAEIKNHTPKFQSKQWEARRLSIKKKIEKKNKKHDR